MFHIEPRAVSPMQPLHRLPQICIRSLQNAVMMIPQQSVRMDHDTVSFMHFRQQLKEMLSVAVDGEDLLPLDSASKDVVPSVLNVDPKGPSHITTSLHLSPVVKTNV